VKFNPVSTQKFYTSISADEANGADVSRFIEANLLYLLIIIACSLCQTKK
jgi:hypothetical protein